MLTDRERLILLNVVPDIGPLRLKRLLDHFKRLERIWKATVRDLQQVEGVGPQVAQRLFDGCRNERLLEEELVLAKRHGVALVTLHDPEYPKALRDIYDPPLALYVRGTIPAGEQAAVAIVGSRRASLYGLETAERLAYDLALRGATVVSGLARGIDGAAHRGALKADGSTVAFLGNGLASMYPPEHEALADQIALTGAVVSEYPMRMEPLAHNFPRRNRLISGLSLGVVIVEAAQRSGALITCDCALEQGKDVFAVPGKIDSVTSQGTHRLLREGAKLVTGVEDILEELGRSLPPAISRARRVLPDQDEGEAHLTENERRLLGVLSPDAPRGFDEVAGSAGFSAEVCAATLLGLELKRRVRQLPGTRFVKS